MRTLSKLMIAAGSSARLPRPAQQPSWRKGSTFRDRVSELILAGLRTASVTTTGATPIMTVRASTRNGDITEGPMRMNVAGVTAIGTREAYSQICGAVRAFARAALLCGSVKRRAQNHLGQLLRGFYFTQIHWELASRAAPSLLRRS
jgi:hypothetical protein